MNANIRKNIKEGCYENKLDFPKQEDFGYSKKKMNALKSARATELFTNEEAETKTLELHRQKGEYEKAKAVYRKEAARLVEKFKEDITDYEKRLHIRPGITGLAQVWYRYDETIEDVKKKLKYDLLYVKKMCLQADFRILFRTMRVVLTGEGAR